MLKWRCKTTGTWVPKYMWYEIIENTEEIFYDTGY